MFQGRFEDLNCKWKAIIPINNSPIDISQIYLEIYKYKSKLEVTLSFHNVSIDSFLFGIPKPSAHFCDTFIEIATKNKAKYKKIKQEEEANTQKEQMEETVGVLQESKFTSYGFGFDW